MFHTLENKLVHALLAKPVSSSFRARALANGISRANFVSLRSYLKENTIRQAQLPMLLEALALKNLEKANYWLELGLAPHAKDHLLQTSLLALYAQLFSGGDSDIYKQGASSYLMATPLFDYQTKRIEIPFPGGNLPGYLRLPIRSAAPENPEQKIVDAGNGPFPLVILCNGFNSAKEELHYCENSFLNEGLATLSFDYPGQGESAGGGLEELDFISLQNGIDLFLRNRGEIDREKMGIYGLSWGGASALKLATLHDTNYKAIATISAPFDISYKHVLLLGLYKNEFLYLTNPKEDTARAISHHYAVSQDLRHLRCPALTISGGKDPIVSTEDVRSQYNLINASDKKLMIYASAGHGCYQVMPSLRYEVAQWMKLRLGNS